MTAPINILVVDDEVDMQELIPLLFRKGIKRGHYAFQYAFAGQEALDMLSADSEIDIILLDINMPEMDGLTVLEKAKEIPHLFKTIMVTAYENMENIRAAMNGGAFDFVSKPIDQEDLETTILKAHTELQQLKEGAEAQRQLPITQQALEATDQKARYLEELDELKSRFFTNISHEFRTPLTVIRGMSDQVVSNPERWLRKGHQMIRRNTDQLLDLVNQILDLRKLEAGQLSLRLEQFEAVAFLRYLTDSFYALAANKEIDLNFNSVVQEIWMDLDEEKMLRIMSNLLSNAIKFTPAGGTVDVNISIEDTSIIISISDTGIGIPPERLPEIFDRFYQVDSSSTREQEGTGIGLALCKELLNLMEGKIQVSSEPGLGTSFRVLIPIQQTAKKVIKELKPLTIYDPLPLADQVEGLRNLVSQVEGEKPSLLIIEDNPDVVEYLSVCLEDQYQLLIARDGQDGITTALEHIPDLIISDVMMPEKDGFEVCDTLKQDVRTSHIPIVLLTAKADDASRIHGLKKGADAYLAKPFNQEELFVRLAKLLEIRQALQARYASDAPTKPEPSEAYQLEDEFLQKVQEVIEDNMNQSYDILAICQLLGLSRSHLHRKIKALTGVSSTKFIRRFRLKKAKQLMQETTLNIAEIAYDVGFNDPSYFTRVFTQEFGISPRGFRGE